MVSAFGFCFDRILRFPPFLSLSFFVFFFFSFDFCHKTKALRRGLFVFIIIIPFCFLLFSITHLRFRVSLLFFFYSAAAFFSLTSEFFFFSLFFFSQLFFSLFSKLTLLTSVYSPSVNKSLRILSFFSFSGFLFLCHFRLPSFFFFSPFSFKRSEEYERKKKSRLVFFPFQLCIPFH